jgi:PAS domain S-box-containing protein
MWTEEPHWTRNQPRLDREPSNDGALGVTDLETQHEPIYIRAQLGNLDGSVIAKRVAMSAEAIWILAERLSGEHIAQVYSHETILSESIRMFTSHGLSRGEAVLLVLTESQRDLLLQHPKADGVDVGGLQDAGQLLLVDVSVAVSPICTRDGEVVGVSVVGREISERKRTEEALQRLAAIVDSSDDAIIGKTLDTTIVSWNRGAERIYGYTAAEVIGRPISVLLPPGSEDEVPAIMERLRHGEKVEHFETKRRRKDGTVIDVSVTVSLIKACGGRIIGASAVARDITERKQAEAARAHMAQLEQSQAAHRRLLERVFETQEQERRRIAREVHDQAGQLMAALLVGLRALDDSIAIDEAKALARHLRAIAVQAIDEVGRLIRGLHSSVLDDHGLAVALRRYVADYSKTHNIAVDLTLNELDTVDLPLEVQLAVFRIIQEALTNVATHSASTAISIRLARSATGLETTIADNGAGFDAASNSVNSETHLGLHSMRERAAILGGGVSVRSGSTGTTILVQLPLDEQDPNATWDRRA